MPTTAERLHLLAHAIDYYGLHQDDQFGRPGNGADILPALDISAFAYVVAEDLDPLHWPTVFYTDDAAAFDLIESSEPAMDMIRAISAALDSDVNDTDGKPDPIEHVSTWATTPGIRQTKPPTIAEVIGRIIRAANLASNADAA